MLILLAATGLMTGCAPDAPDAAPTVSPQATGSPSPDEDAWADYYARASDTASGFSRQSWGSFGLPDEISVVEERDLSMREGAHEAIVSCAGPSSVTFTAYGIDPDSVDARSTGPVLTRRVSCDAASHLVFTTPTIGLGYTVDSAGAPGAYLVQIDSGETTVVP